MADACPSLLAVSYQVLPELRRVVEAWEVRALLAGVGVLAAYVLLRLRGPAPSRPGSAWGAAFRLALGSLAAAGLWLAVDVVRSEDFLAELGAALPPRHENAVKALVLVGCGWAGWSVALAEVFRRLAAARQPRRAEPSAAADPARNVGSPDS